MRSLQLLCGGMAAALVVGAGFVGPARPATEADRTTDEAAAAYVAAVEPLNASFRKYGEASRAAALLDAFEDVAVEIDQLRADYDPAAAELDAVAAAVHEVIAGLEASQQGFDEDVRALTAASNELRHALGLPPARSADD